MRRLVREAGLEHEFEIDSAGTGSWHAGDSPDRRATAAAAARGVDAGGRRPPGPPARLRALRPAARDGPREPARAAHVLPGRRRRRQGAAAARVRPGVAPARPTSTSPTRTTAARTASRRCSTRSRPPAAACSTRCGEPRGRRARRHRPRGAAAWSAWAAATSTRPSACSSPTSRSRSSRPAPTSRRASTRRRPPGCAGSRSLARCACRRCSASATPCSCSTGSTRAAAATPPRSARACGGPRGGRGRVRRRQRRRCGLGSLALPNDPAPDWPTFYAERRLLPLLPARRPHPLRQPGGRERVRAHRTTSPGRPSRPRGCTATCGAATSSGGATAARG